MLAELNHSRRRPKVMRCVRIVLAAAALGVPLAAPMACTDSESGSGPDDQAPTIVTTPDGPAAVRAVLEAPWENDPSSSYRLGQVSDSYYSEMALRLTPDVQVFSGSESVDSATLQVGTTVNVWITGGCRESYPVGCDIAAVEIIED